MGSPGLPLSPWWLRPTPNPTTAVCPPQLVLPKLWGLQVCHPQEQHPVWPPSVYLPTSGTPLSFASVGPTWAPDKNLPRLQTPGQFPSSLRCDFSRGDRPRLELPSVRT